MALAAAGITALYPFFVYYSGVLMTEGVYLLTATWALVATVALAEEQTGWRWGVWGLAVGLTVLLRQVFVPLAGLLLLYVLWKSGWRVRWRDLALAGGVVAALILPWTVRNYLVFDRFLLLNSQSGQILWNANHPGQGVHFQPAGMFPVPADLEGANEVDLTNELGRRAVEIILQDPWRFLRLSLNRLGLYFMFVGSPGSSLLGRAARGFYLVICLPFMVGGLLLSLCEWRHWVFWYLFAAAYTAVHVISWVQYRYRMLVDVALVPFAALAIVALVARLRRGRAGQSSVAARRPDRSEVPLKERVAGN